MMINMKIIIAIITTTIVIILIPISITTILAANNSEKVVKRFHTITPISLHIQGDLAFLLLPEGTLHKHKSGHNKKDIKKRERRTKKE